MSYQIGSITFAYLHRIGGEGRGNAPEGVDQTVSIISRAGVDGINVRLDGLKGKPFQMQSTAFYQTAPLARAAIATYKAIEGEVRGIIWEGVNWLSEYGAVYSVIRVHSPQLRKIGAGVHNGSDITNYWQVTALWDLVGVDPAHVTA